MEHGVHHIPGRIRYKIPGLRPDEMQAVSEVLERCDDVEHVEARPVSASLVIHYDPAHTDARHLGIVFGQTVFKIALEQAVRGGLNSLHGTVLAKS